MTLRRRFVALFLLVSLAPILLIQVYTFFFYVPSISTKIRTLIDYNLQQKGENIHLLLRGDIDIIYQIAGDPGISDIIRGLATADPSTLALQESKLVAEFSRLSLFHDSLAGVGYLGPDGRLVEFDKYMMVRDAAEFNRFLPLGQIRQRVDRDGGLQVFPTTEFRDRADLPKNLVVVAFPFVDVAHQAKNGYLFLLLRESALRDILNPPESADIGILTRTFLFDASGSVLSAPEDRLLSQAHYSTSSYGAALISLVGRQPELRGKPLNLSTMAGPLPGSALVAIYDESSVFSDRNVIAGFTAAVGLFFLVLSGGATFWVYRTMFRSVSRLMESIAVDDTRLGITRSGTSGDEFEILGAAWSGMRDQISQLVDAVNARNESLVAVVEERRLAEVRALEAQVNPHFLFNTLNTLNWMAISNGQAELSQALSDLGDIMRYSISQIDVVATLGEETVWLQKYLSLQRLRFGKNLTCDLQTQGADPGFRVYKLLLQPFVENALVHGLDHSQPGQRLDIQLEVSSGRRLRAVVHDTGKGFDPASVRERI